MKPPAPNFPNSAQDLLDAHQNAAQALIQYVTETFPIGCIVNVCLHGNWITGRVIYHNSAWWHDPGQTTVVNTATGKHRRFNAAKLDAACLLSCIELPTKP